MKQMKKNRIISAMLTILMIASMVIGMIPPLSIEVDAATYSSYSGVNFSNASISSQRKAALTKAMQMVTIQWVCPADFPTWRSKGGVLNTVTATDGTSSQKFIKGKTYTGIPYSMKDHTYSDISWDSAIRNGKITTSYMTGSYYGNGNTTAHGSDCSYFVYLALSASGAGSISYQTTSTMLNSSYYSKISWDTLKPADLFLKSGHVMMFVGMSGSNYAVFECNAGDSKCSYNVYTKSQLSSYSCYRYNSFSATDSSAPTYANLGDDFTAPILNKAAWITITNSYMESDKPPVRIQKETGTSDQLWYFDRQSDGSYKISSCYDGKFLDVRDASLSAETIVQTCDDSGTDAQKWYFIEESGGYIIKSKLGDFVLDLKNNNTSPGNNLQIYPYNGSTAQIWSVYRGSECILQAPTLSVSSGSSISNVTFSWSESYGESGYHVKIWKNILWEDDPYHIEWDTKSGYSLKLPVGTYQAYVDVSNFYEIKMSNVVTFTVYAHECSYSTSIISPTCTTEGYTTYTCSACGHSYNGNYKSALGHKYYSYQVYDRPTTSYDGSIYGRCSRCSDVTFITLPYLNTSDYSYSVVSDPTYTSTGTGRYTWKNTSYGTFYFDVTIPQLNNVFSYRIAHWACGFKNSEGTNGDKNAVNIGYDTYESIYNSQYTLDSNKALSKLPNGFYLYDSFATPSISGTWERYPLGTTVTQTPETMYFEYTYLPIDYTITYNLNGGTNSSANPSTYNVLYGITLAAPTKDGYLFKGWVDESDNPITGINKGLNADFASTADYNTFCNVLSKRTTGNRVITATWKRIGDINDDGKLNIADSISLFRYSMMPAFYPVSYTGNMNFNNIGAVDIDDVILLFQHSLMPNIYPLFPVVTIAPFFKIP